MYGDSPRKINRYFSARKCTKIHVTFLYFTSSGPQLTLLISLQNTANMANFVPPKTPKLSSTGTSPLTP